MVNPSRLFFLSVLVWSQLAFSQEKPDISIFTNSPFCPGQKVFLFASVTRVPGSAMTYRWSGPNGFAATTAVINIPNATAANAGVYSMTVTYLDKYAGSYVASTTLTTGIPDHIFGLNYPARNSYYGFENEYSGCGPLDFSLNVAYTSLYTNDTSYYPRATYLWEGPNGFRAVGRVASAPQAAAGQYTVTTTLANGCGQTKDNVRIRYGGPFLTVLVNVEGANQGYRPALACPGQPVQLKANLSQFSPISFKQIAYRWTGPNGFVSTEQNPVLGPITSRMFGTYRVTMTYSGDCSGVTSSEVTIAEPALRVQPYDGDSTFCAGQTVRLTSDLGNHQELTKATYRWTGPNGFSSSTGSEATITRMPDVDRAVYTLTVTLGSNCALSKQVIMTRTTGKLALGMTANVDSSGSVGALCPGQAFRLQAYALPYRDRIVAYRWAGPNNFRSTDSNPRLPADPTGRTAGVYSLTATFAACPAPVVGTVQARLAVPDMAILPLAYRPDGVSDDVPGDSAICPGEKFRLIPTDQNQTAGLTFSHQLSGPRATLIPRQSDTLRFGPELAGVYSLTTTYAGTCAGTLVTTKKLNYTTPDVRIEGFPTICPDKDVTLEAVPTHIFPEDAVSFRWAGPGGFSSNAARIVIPAANANATGPYSVSVTYPAFCQSLRISRSVTLTAGLVPSARFLTTDTTLIRGDSLRLRVALGGSSPWGLSVLTPDSVRFSGIVQSPYSFRVRPDSSTLYRLVSVRNGCGTVGLSGAVRVRVLAPLAVTTPPDEAPLRLWPNPTTGRVQVRWYAPLGQAVTLSLLDPAGRLLRDELRRGSGQAQFSQWDLHTSPGGAYIVQITGPDGSVSRRLLKL